MKKNELIQKWLDHDLAEEELEAFKQLDAYSSLHNIDAAAKNYKAPPYDSDSEYKRLMLELSREKKQRFPKHWIAIAAVLVVTFSVYLTVFKTNNVVYTTIAKTEENIRLPDASLVTLLPNSEIQFNETNWDDTRALSLKGAAYFDVEKGAAFSVQSEHGMVTVLGTQFSIKDWGTYFEVICFEGSVQVDGYNKTQVLTPGMSFKSVNETVLVESVANNSGTWSSKNSYFKSVPLDVVLGFIERNYAVNITNKKDFSGIFSGTVSHEDITEALQSVTIPFQLTFDIRNENIILKSE